jgi:pimeloyl-ACP methyl ester carboxylesterase
MGMPTATVNGVDLYYELDGDGPVPAGGVPLVLVHGSWVDHHVWDSVVPLLTGSLVVLTYDRRGHSRSGCTPRQGSTEEDADDLAALIEALDLAPAHIAGASWGGSIVLRLACRRPELFRSLAVHEPPLFALVADEPKCRGALRDLNSTLAVVAERLGAGDMEGGARHYVDQTSSGYGTWAKLPRDVRATFVANAQTYLDQLLSPDQWTADLTALSHFPHPALLTQGDQRDPMFGRILDRVAEVLPQPQRRTLPGTAHAPQLTHPEMYAEAIMAFTSTVDERASSV